MVRAGAVLAPPATRVLVEGGHIVAGSIVSLGQAGAERPRPSSLQSYVRRLPLATVLGRALPAGPSR